MQWKNRMVKRDFHLYRLVAYMNIMYTNINAYKMANTRDAAAIFPNDAMVSDVLWVAVLCC